MKTLVLVTDLYGAVGGIATFNRLFLHALSELSRRSDESLTVLALHDPCPPQTINVPAGADYYAFGGNRWRFALAAWREGRHAARIFFGHLHLSPLAWTMPRPERILIVHGLEVWRPLSNIRRWSAQRMDQIWAVSRYTASELVKQEGAIQERCVIFPNSLGPVETGPSYSRAALRLPDGKMLLSVSRLSATESYKQIDFVLESLPALIADHPDLIYVIVGEGSDRARLEALSLRLNVAGRVIFAGLVREEQLASYYEACDLFVLPSLEEGFGIVFLEAMRHAKPCVGARAGGVPEVIEDGKTGFLSAPRDRLSFQKAVGQLLADQRLRRTMGQAGRKKFDAEFAFNHFTNRMRQLLAGEVLPAQRLAA